MKYNDAFNLYKKVRHDLLKLFGIKTYAVGSLKRKSDVNDIDLITTNDIFNDPRKKFVKFKYNEAVINLWKTTPDNLKFSKMMLELDKGHQIGFKKLAKKKGYLLNNYGLYDKFGKRFNINTLSDLYTKLIT